MSHNSIDTPLRDDEISVIASKYFEDFQRKNTAPGFGWAILQNGHITHETFVGTGEASQNQPLDRHSIFRIASMTKSFTAVAVLQLRDKGVLDLDTKVSLLSGKFSLPSELGELTPRQLLTMTGSLPTDDPSADRLLGSSDAHYTEILSARPLRVHPNAQKFNYSNLSYMLLGRLITILAGKSSLDFIVDEICKPLGMLNTSWQPSIDKTVGGHFLLDGKWSTEPPILTAGDGDTFGGLWSSVEDLARWVSFLSASDDTGNSVLARASLLELQTPRSKMSPAQLVDGPRNSMLTQYGSYAYGLAVTTIEGEGYVGHSGGLPGYSSHMRWSPETGLGIVAFTNATYAPIWDPCALALHHLVKRCSDRPTTPTPLILERAGDLESLIRNFNTERVTDAFSANVFQDHTLGSIKRDFERARSGLGTDFKCTSIAMSGGLAATAILHGLAESTIELTFSLSPFDGGKIQQYRFK